MRVSFRRIIIGIFLLPGLPLLWISFVKEIGNNNNTSDQQTNILGPKTGTKAVLGRELSSSIDNNNEQPENVPSFILEMDGATSFEKRTDVELPFRTNATTATGAKQNNNNNNNNNNNKNQSAFFNNILRYFTNDLTTLPRSKITLPSLKEDCPHLKETVIPKSDQEWQPVSEDNAAFVFSAFLDSQIGRIVRVIGIKSRSLSPDLFCQIWFDEKNNSRTTNNYKSTEKQQHIPRFVVVSAILRLIPEDHGAKFTSCYFLCPLHEFSFKVMPRSISVVHKNKCAKPFNHLSIVQNWPSEKVPKKEFTLCLSPLHYHYSRAYELVEWMEVNQLFGADYFVFYNASIQTNVRDVLKQYIEEGVAEIIKWHLPLRKDTLPQIQLVDIHYYGQLAAINDCLYRNQYKSKYVVFMDVDEFIVPRNGQTWSMMFENFKDKYNLGAYVFKCSFFRKEWEDAPQNFSGKDLALKYRSVSLLKLNRESKIYPMFIRSKIIVQPLRVETMGIHNVWAFRPGYQPIEVRQTQALLHHYRNWFNPKTNNRVYDDTMHTFKDNILQRLVQRWDKLKNVPLIL